MIDKFYLVDCCLLLVDRCWFSSMFVIQSETKWSVESAEKKAVYSSGMTNFVNKFFKISQSLLFSEK